MRGLKINAGKSKMIILNGEEGLEYEVHVEGCVLNESVTDEVECSRKVASERRVAVAIRSLAIA